MTKEQMVTTMANAAGITKKQAATALDAFCTAVGDTMRSGDKLTLTGFGTFSVEERKARQGRNPRTNEPLTIPACKMVKFHPGKQLKDALN